MDLVQMKLEHALKEVENLEQNLSRVQNHLKIVIEQRNTLRTLIERIESVIREYR
jgi:hypothetical protein